MIEWQVGVIIAVIIVALLAFRAYAEKKADDDLRAAFRRRPRSAPSTPDTLGDAQT